VNGEDKDVVPQKLPEAEVINGMHYEPHTETVRLQYLSRGKLYELSMPLEEALKAEEWFIKVREQLGAHMRQLRNREPT
jgi:hypothetical protein